MLKMVQKEYESLKEFVKRLLYHLKRSGHADIGRGVLKIILLRGIREYFMDMLNLLGREVISREYFDHIVDQCRRYSRGSSKTSIKD